MLYSKSTISTTIQSMKMVSFSKLISIIIAVSLLNVELLIAQSGSVQQQPPSQVITSETFTVQVLALDGKGQPWVNVPVVAGVANDPSGLLQGTLEVYTDASGIAEFSDLQIDQAINDIQLLFYAGDAFELFSNTFSIVTSAQGAEEAGGAPSFAIPNEPTGAIPTATGAQLVRVRLLDETGAPVGDLNDVPITITSSNNDFFGAGTPSRTVNSVNGKSDFWFAMPTTPGDEIYTFTVSSPGYTSVNTTGFTLTTRATSVEFSVQPPSSVNLNEDFSFTARLIDGEGGVVLNETHNITVSIANDPSSGSAVLSGTKTQTIDLSTGLATFTALQLNEIHNNYSLGISSDITGISSSTSSSLNVTGTPSFAIPNQPTGSVPSSSGAQLVRIRLLDAAGSPVTLNDVPVTLTSSNNDFFGTDTPSRTVNSVNGLSDFWFAAPSTPGDETYTFTATSSGYTSANTTGFTVSARATAIAFSVQPSSNVNMNEDFGVTVRLIDGTGTTVLNETHDISISLSNDPSGGSATLSGTTTQTVNLGTGSSVFSSLQLNESHNGYSLRASSGINGISPIVSNTFNVVSNPYIEITNQHIGQVPTFAGSQLVRIRLRNADGTLANETGTPVLLTANESNFFEDGVAAKTIHTNNGVADLWYRAPKTPKPSNDPDGLYRFTITSTNYDPATTDGFEIISRADNIFFSAEPKNSVNGHSLQTHVQLRSGTDPVINEIQNINIQIESDGSTGGNAILSGTLTQTVNRLTGVATFNDLQIDQPGSYTLKATCAETGLTIVSQSFEITPASLSISTQPGNGANISAGSEVTYNVQLVTPSDVPVLQAGVQIAIQDNDNVISSGNTLSATTNELGVANFQINFNRPGNNYEIHFSADQITAPESSNSFNVLSKATSLVFATQPANSVSNGSIPDFQVRALDTHGALVTDEQIEISITIGPSNDPSGGSATLSGITAVQTSNGVSTFEGLSINEPGLQYKLLATATNVGNVSSDYFDISGEVSLPNSSMSISNNGAIADGISEISIVMTMRDINNTPIKKIPVYKFSTVTTAPVITNTLDFEELDNGAYELKVRSINSGTFSLDISFESTPFQNPTVNFSPDHSLFRGKLTIGNIASASSNYYQLSFSFEDLTSTFTSNDIQAGDWVYDRTFNRFEIVSVSGNSMTVFTSEGALPTTGIGAIIRPTENFRYPLSIAGIPAPLQSYIFSSTASLIDNRIAELDNTPVNETSQLFAAKLLIDPTGASQFNFSIDDPTGRFNSKDVQIGDLVFDSNCQSFRVTALNGTSFTLSGIYGNETLPVSLDQGVIMRVSNSLYAYLLSIARISPELKVCIENKLIDMISRDLVRIDQTR